jgi:multicomponent Na+:H+ antiporter subunit D
VNVLVAAPIVLPLLAAAAGLVVWRSPRLQRLVGLVGAVGLLVAGVALLVVVEREGIVTMQAAGWPAPFGITLVADLLSAIMVVLAGVLGVAVMVYSGPTIDARRTAFGYYPLMLVLLAGVCGTFVTGDLFNLYVWFEVLLIASFVLLALGGERAQLEGALKYVALNLVASAILLVTIGVLYGLTGTVNMADLSLRVPAISPDGLETALAAMLLVAFGIKAAVVPLYFWLPASYHTPPVAVSAVFAGLLTKVGVYALVRVFTLVFPADAVTLQPLLLAAAGLTMVVGVLGAVAQHEMRRLLSFHIISQIGYLVMGLALFSVAALAGLIYFLVHVAIAKSTLFLVSGAVERLTGTFELAGTGGLYARRPGLAILFLVGALSLAGVPPFSGFLAKLALVQAGLALDQLVIVGVALAVSLLTLYSMLKIWNAAFWKPLPEARATDPAAHSPPVVDVGTAVEVHPKTDTRLGPAAEALETPPAPGPAVTASGPGGSVALRGERRVGPQMTLAIVGLAACTIALSVAAGPAFELMGRAAAQLLDPSAYIEAVLGTAR